MSCTMTRRNRNPGTASGSGNQTCKQNTKTCSAPTTGTISKYFLKENVPQLAESPHKNCLNQVKTVELKANNSTSDMDDFKTPKSINKVSKIMKPKITKNKNVKKRKQSKSVTPLQKFVETNLKHADVNSDHLQMALALSESSYQAENPDRPSSQEKTKSFREAFEMYGFGYPKNKSKSKEENVVCRRNKKSRYRFVTPILKIRTEADRQAMISSKVTLILAQNERKTTEFPRPGHVQLFSDYLRSQNVGAKLFKLNQRELKELNDKQTFYVKELGLEICVSLCGKLLKDWTKIAGRDISPERRQHCSPKKTQSSCFSPDEEHMLNGCSKFATKPEEILAHIDATIKTVQSDHNTSGVMQDSGHKTRRSVSPDLFEQDEGEVVDEADSLAKIRDNRNEQHLDGGIECYDLTKSDDETPILAQSQRKIEKLSISEGNDVKISQESICVSDDELNYSSAFRTPSPKKKKVQYSISDDDDDYLNLELSLEKRLRSKFFANSSSKDTASSLRNSSNRSCETETSFSGQNFDSSNTAPTEKPKRFEKISTSEEENTDLSSFISNDELGDSSVLGISQQENKVQSKFSDIDESCFKRKLSLDEETVPKITQPSAETYELFPNSLLQNESPNLKYTFNLSSDAKGSGSGETMLGAADRIEHLKRFEKISTSEEDDTILSQGSIYVSDDEPNDSAKSLSQSRRNTQFTFSNEDEDYLTRILSLEEKVQLKLDSSRLSQNEAPSSILNCNAKKWTSSGQESNVIHCAQSPKRFEKINSSKESRTSQESIYISDDELNYSSAIGTSHLKKNVSYNFSDDEENYLTHVSLAERIKVKAQPTTEAHCSKTVSNELRNENVSSVVQDCDAETPKKNSDPDFLIKTSGVTPMQNYDEMNTPNILKELDKIGVKPLKRKKGAKLLKYIYESTHPVVEDDQGKVVKKQRTETLHVEGIVCELGNEDDLFFEKIQSKQIASCRVPLHIVWHNFVKSNLKIREKILLYEPLQLEALHSMIKEQGFAFKIQDLLSFLDKKCITFWTSQGQNHGKKRR